MTPPSPAAVAAAVDHCRERMKQYWESPDVDRDKLETILAALAAQSEELAEARKDVKKFRDGIGTALATLKNYMPRSGSLVDATIDILEAAIDRQPSKAGGDAAMQQEQKP